MEDFRCNLLIMGKTGTGKSTLLNYICGNHLAKTGTGKPVTQEGLFEYLVMINGQEVKIFDSWGIEAGKVERWKTLIDNALKEHGVQKSMEEWFHSVIYCIQAGGGRVEDVDSEIIKRFLQEGYHLTIVLTKADQIDEDDEAQLKKTILKEIEGAVKAEKRGLLKVISTCAEEKKTRSGVTKPFGKEDVQEAILSGWRETIIDRMPKHVIARMCEEIDFWGANVKNELRGGEIEISGVESENDAIFGAIGDLAKEFAHELQTELLTEILKESIESCHRANTALQKVLAVDNIDLGELPSFEKDTIDRILIFVKGFLKGFFVIPAVIDYFKRRSEERKIDQQVRIEEFVDQLCEKMKEEFTKQEPAIAKTIAQSLK